MQIRVGNEGELVPAPDWRANSGRAPILTPIAAKSEICPQLETFRAGKSNQWRAARQAAKPGFACQFLRKFVCGLHS